MKKPATGFVPQGWTPPAVSAGVGSNVDANTVLKVTFSQIILSHYKKKRQQKANAK